MIIKISKDFSPAPGGREEGKEFLETLLKPKYIEAVQNWEKLVIDLDGGYGYPTSFLKEAFGGLIKEHNSREVLDTLVFISNDEPSLIDEIRSYMSSSEKEDLLSYIDSPYLVKGNNIMGCSENWYNPYFAIYQTFSRDEVEKMSDEEVTHLVKLADNIADGLY